MFRSGLNYMMKKANTKDIRNSWIINLSKYLVMKLQYQMEEN